MKKETSASASEAVVAPLDVAALTAAIVDLAVAIRSWGEIIAVHARSAGAVSSPVETAAPQPAAPPPPVEVSYEEVKNTVLELIKRKGRDAALAVLSRFGAKTAKDVTSDQYQALIDACFEAYDRG